MQHVACRGEHAFGLETERVGPCPRYVVEENPWRAASSWSLAEGPNFGLSREQESRAQAMRYAWMRVLRAPAWSAFLRRSAALKSSSALRPA
jgi:hypothetical protein